jgi:biopolymer transport protein TolR
MAEINVTPFVDVMLVLLIVFMVTAPLLTAGIEVNLPETRAEQMQTEADP